MTKLGWDGGGGGNRIRLKHAQGYESSYMHLSRYAPGLRVGSRVSQGDLIGYVGATGTATGPHLDFRVWENGTPINPLTMESPDAEPLREELRPMLDSVSRRYRAELDSLLAAPADSVHR